jgi:hypothetical protein
MSLTHVMGVHNAVRSMAMRSCIFLKVLMGPKSSNPLNWSEGILFL